MLADWSGTQSSDLLAVDENFLFLAVVQGRECGGKGGNGF